MSRICITGAAGFIGSHLVEGCLERNHEVIGVDDCSTGFWTNIEPMLDRFDFRKFDVREADRLADVLEDVDWVLHQAAIPSVPISLERPVETSEVNVMGTVRLMQAAVEAGVDRFVYASSSSVYGDQEQHPQVETMTRRPESPYAQTKATCEDFARMYTRHFDLHTVGLRYFNVFGPRQNPDSQYAAVIPNFIRSMLDGERATIYGDGEQTRDFLYVKDVVRANLAAAREGKPGEVYNVGYNREMTINELHDRLADLCGVDVEPVYEDAREGDVRRSKGDVSLLRRDTGFDPEFTVEEGLKRTVEYFRSVGSG